MRLEVFCVYDSATGAYMQPFFARSTGEALRSFTELANDPKTSVHKYPSDYTLFLLGFWDDNSGIFSTSPPERVIGALECQIKTIS